jgi:hypothetical protein
LRSNKRYRDFGFSATVIRADLLGAFLDLNPVTLNLPVNFTSCTRPKNIAMSNKAVSIKVVFNRQGFKCPSFYSNKNPVPEIQKGFLCPVPYNQMPVLDILHKV